MRLTGMLVGHEGGLPAARELPGHLPRRRRQARRELRGDAAASARQPSRGGLLVGAINDPSALGALRALQEAGRAESCAIMGQNASPEGRAELRAAGHPPDRIGRVLSRRSTAPRSSPSRSTSSTAAPVPPAVFVKHQLVTPETVNHIYPNDRADADLERDDSLNEPDRGSTPVSAVFRLRLAAGQRRTAFSRRRGPTPAGHSRRRLRLAAGQRRTASGSRRRSGSSSSHSHRAPEPDSTHDDHVQRPRTVDAADPDHLDVGGRRGAGDRRDEQRVWGAASRANASGTVSTI